MRMVIVCITAFIAIEMKAQWVNIGPGTLEEFDAVLVDGADTYWVGGDAGTLLHTIDGGATWSSQTLPAGDLGRILRLSGNTLLIAADDGLVARSTDNGATWTMVNTQAPNVLYDITYFGDLLWASGRDGGIVHSTDQGVTWTVQTSGTLERLHGIFALSANDVICVGREGVLLRTSDAGNTWQMENIAGGDDLRGIIFLDDPQRTGLIAGPAGEIYRSIDLGATWTPVSYGSVLEAQALASDDPGVVYAVGDQALILRSVDQGLSWQPMTSPAFSELSGVHVKDGAAVAAGALGAIIKLGGPQSVQETQLAGWINIYPNPASGPVSIEWKTLEAQSDGLVVELFLMDGRLVDRTVWPVGKTHAQIGYLDPGNYMIRLIGENGAMLHKPFVVVRM